MEYVMAPRLLAMLGRTDEARDRLTAGNAYLDERGLRSYRGSFAFTKGAVEALGGDLEGAQRAYAEGIAILQPMGGWGVISTLAAERATLLYRLGRMKEMDEAIQLAKETGSATDIATQGEWRSAAALRAADEGRLAEAVTLMREATALLDPTDFLELRGRVFEAQAHVEARAGRPKGWRAALEQALTEHERKGNLVDSKRIRDLMAVEPPAPVA